MGTWPVPFLVHEPLHDVISAKSTTAMTHGHAETDLTMRRGEEGNRELVGGVLAALDSLHRVTGQWKGESEI